MLRNRRTAPGLAQSLLMTTALTCALGATGAVAQWDDTSKSDMTINIDTQDTFAASGTLRVDESDAYAGGTAGELAVPGRFWAFTPVYGALEWAGAGARDVILGIEGKHLDGPHDDDDDPNTLRYIHSKMTAQGLVDIDWGKSKVISLATIAPHPTLDPKVVHNDWYGASWQPKPVDATADTPRHLAGAGYVVGRHAGLHQKWWPYPKWETVGSGAKSGSASSYDPSSRTLTLAMGVVDILDADGGRTGSIDPAFGEDPALDLTLGVVQMRYAGFDAERGEHVFRDGELLAEGPGALRIAGLLGEFRIATTLPADSLGAWGSFEPIVVIDAGEPEDSPSPWARGFVERGWFGGGLGGHDRSRLLFPVMTFWTDGLDLVSATEGFSQAAELPATILLTIATDPTPPCRTDLNLDGRVNTRDVLVFLRAWSAGDPAADWNGDGEISSSDVHAFLNDWRAGCGGGGGGDD